MQGYTHITIILDRSGSMESIRDDIIGGFNAFLREQKAQPGEATLTLVQFDSQDSYEVLEDVRPIADVSELTAAKYIPRASTPLLDTLGRGISDLTAKIATLPENRRPEHVVFVILTDGRENASQEFDKARIVEMICKCREEGWHFLFLSADLDAIHDAVAYGFDPAATVGFDKTDAGTVSAYAATSRLLSELRSGRGLIEDTKLRELLRDGTITVVFQPIVALPQESLVGYEALGRGCHPQLPESPMQLFRIAESIGAEAELSRRFREQAVAIAEARPRFPLLFLNVHAAELAGEGLASSVLATCKRRPDLRLALELREEVLEDLGAVEQLRAALNSAGVGLAYDGFGASEARLLALAEVPPDYLKFDSLFVRGINTAPQRQRLLGSLLALARDLGVSTVAQGVETAEEAETCRRLGFSHAQGFFFGKPKPIDQL